MQEDFDIFDMRKKYEDLIFMKRYYHLDADADFMLKNLSSMNHKLLKIIISGLCSTLRKQFFSVMHLFIPALWLNQSLTKKAMAFILNADRGVAQLASAPALGAGSRRFKSSHPDHLFLSHS